MNPALLRQFRQRGTMPGGVSLSMGYALTPALVNGETIVRATTARFVGSDGLIQSAAANIARFAYNPSTLASLGLLVEPAATNHILQSEDLATTWTQLNTTVSANKTDLKNEYLFMFGLEKIKTL